MQETQAVDVSSAAKLANQNLSAANTYIETSRNQKKLRRQKGSSWQESSKKTSEQLNKISEQQKRFQRKVPTSMDQMLNLLKLTSGSGQTKNYARNLILQTAIKCEPQIKNIIKEEGLKALGCSEEQTYTGIDVSRLNSNSLQSMPLNETIFIPLQSLDIITLAGGMLKREIPSPVGRLLYEQSAATPQNLTTFKPYGGKVDFPMNASLNNLTNNTNQSFRQLYGQYYLGSSGQYLMDLQYSTSNEFNITGDYLRIGLLNRSGGTISATSTAVTNSVGTFLSDYYSTIKLFDTRNLGAQILNFLTRFMEMQGKLGAGEITQSSKFFLIAQRILGLCFDNRREIDVSGVAKVAELDGVDDKFFEVDEIDLREIDLNVSNVQNGVIELIDCDNVKLPIDYQNITEQLITMGDKLSGMTLDQQVSAINEIIDSVSSNPNWKIYTNSNFNAQGAFGQNLITNIALAVSQAALSPKTLLPIFIMLAVLQKSAINTWNTQVPSANTLNESATTINNQIINVVSDSVQFLKKFKKFGIQVISKIGAVFLRTMFELIKKDILNIIALIIQDITLSEKMKKYRTILRLVGIATALAGEIIKGLQDYRKCKSLLDNINNIISIINGIPKKRTKLPVVLAILSDFLPGESPQRATINTIKYLQELGIPTGPLPDGSPNLTLQMLFAAQKGDKDEQADNGVSDTFLVPTKEGLPRWVTLPR